ncbi:MAG TPA: hypothetical protein VNZ48_11160 [Xanthobacteraceae bacterium]|nr:hypothetical protein [Xanthobacteraceae bacterium]
MARLVLEVGLPARRRLCGRRRCHFLTGGVDADGCRLWRGSNAPGELRVPFRTR